MLRIVSVFWMVLAASVAGAQEAQSTIPSSVLTLDRDVLFQGSVYGQSLLSELEQESAALAAENRKIEAELVAEEGELTALRETLEPEEFRERAMAFDEKVVGLRNNQDEKTRQLLAKRDNLQQTFYQQVLPILGQITRELGAVAILDKRVVFLSAGQIDITQEAIERIDAQLGPKQTPPAQSE